MSRSDTDTDVSQAEQRDGSRAPRPRGCRAIRRNPCVDHRQEPLGDLLAVTSGRTGSPSRDWSIIFLMLLDGDLRAGGRGHHQSPAEPGQPRSRSTPTGCRRHPGGGRTSTTHHGREDHGVAPGYLLGVDDTGPRPVRSDRVRRSDVAAGRVLRDGDRARDRRAPGPHGRLLSRETDTVISRATDVVLALPILLLALGIASACGANQEGCFWGLIKPGLGPVILIIGLFGWPYIARIVRGQVLSLREKDSSRRRVPRSIEPADHHPGGPPQRGCADHRLHDADHPEQHPVRGRSVVPRRRVPDTAPSWGGDARRCRHGLPFAPGS